jgi:hypothetical protein
MHTLSLHDALPISTFRNAIDILDEMSICNVPPGHYAEVDMTDTEKILIQKTEEANGIK